MSSSVGDALGDDFFGAQDDTPESREAERARDLQKLERLHVATGFRDAAEGAREKYLQAGFDEGFGAAAAVAAPAGFWLGAAAVLDAAATAGISPADGGGDAAALRRSKLALRNGLRALAMDGKVDGVASAEEAVRAAAPGIEADSSISAEVKAPGESGSGRERSRGDVDDGPGER